MKINKIYISAFGKLKDYTLDFTDGLNIIYGENENGKSTVMAFIKMMFYGSGRASSQIAKSPRVKYTPWSGEKMAGKIYFEHNSTSYCLEREFMKSDSTDRVRLTNLDLGTTEVASPTVGNDFFAISASAFERTVFIGSTGGFLSDDEANGEINSKLSNIALTGDEDISYEAVISRITDAKYKLMSKRGKTGKYDKGLLELEELKRELENAKEAEARKAVLKARIENIKNESELLSKNYIKVKQIVDSENDIKNRQRLEEYLSLKAELDELNKKTQLKDGSFLDESFVKSVEFCISKVDNVTQKTEEIKEEIKRTEESIALAENTSDDELEKRQTELKALLTNDKEKLKNIAVEIESYTAQERKITDSISALNQKRKPFSPVLLILSLPLIISAIIMFFINQTVIAAVLAATGVICLGLSFILKPYDKTAVKTAQEELMCVKTKLTALKTDEAELTRAVYKNTEDLNRLLTILGEDKAVLEHRKLALNELLLKLTEAESRQTTTVSELITVFSKYKAINSIEEIKALLPELYTISDKQKQLKLKLKYMCDDLGGISYEAAREKLNKLSCDNIPTATDFEDKRKELDELNEKITTLKSEFSAISTELKTAFKKAKNSLDLEKQIKLLSDSLDDQKYFCQISDIAAAALEKSFAEVRRSYGSVLEKKALSVFSLLTGGAYSQVGISKSLDITVEKTNNFGTKELDYLSNGTIDQAYLSLRLALCELITDKEKLPLLLDDVLCQYDDKRADTAIKFLQEYSSSSQAVLFTCHRWVCDLAENCGIEVKKL